VPLSDSRVDERLLAFFNYAFSQLVNITNLPAMDYMSTDFCADSDCSSRFPFRVQTRQTNRHDWMLHPHSRLYSWRG